ncbi:hypothetical protein PENSPDRAFT_614841 [Peniophora sp. CONT]|nr:hypothetical protein PENSPDRAFT_614841 [Peniophora sp. CONT]
MPKHLRPTKFVRLSDFKDKAWQRLPRKPDPFGPGRDESESRDAFVQLQLDPLHESTNARMLAHFVTDMGRIRKRAQTGLTWRSQRRMAKAVRRAKMMGLMPILRRDNPFEDRADSIAKRYR